jgi:competence protein ComEC
MGQLDLFSLLPAFDSVVSVLVSLAASPKARTCQSRGQVVSIAAMSQLVLLATVACHPLSSGRPDGKLHFDFLDVGQGDSALVTMPNGTTLLVDAGGRPTFTSSTQGVSDTSEREGTEHR